jgi:beta-carotene ketolase (CrtO type)
MAGKNEHDVIVIGAGQNGLTTAAYLAKAGLDVVVLEANNWIGGATSTIDTVAPGFRNDNAASGFIYALGNPAFSDDELGIRSKYGFNLVSAQDPTMANLFTDNTSLCVYNSLDKTCDEIAKFSQHDADAYRKFFAYLSPMLPLMSQGMYSAPPKMGQLLYQLDQTPIGQEFLKILFMSAWDLISTWFEHPKTLNFILNLASESMVDPEAGGSAYYVLATVVTQHIPGMIMQFPEGGMQLLPDSLVRCLKDHGGNVLTDHEVVTIKTKGGRATGVVCSNGEEFTARKVVVSTVHPQLTLNKWLDTPLSDLKDKIERIKEPAFSGLICYLALEEQPKFKAGGDTGFAATTFVLTPDLSEMRTYFHDLRLGNLPQPVKFLGFNPSKADKSRAPEGKAAMYLWQFVPYYLKDGGPQKWDSVKEEAMAKVIDKYFSLTTNLSAKSILGKQIRSPLDFEKWNKNLLHGSIMGPSTQLFQNMAYKPIPELGQYRTPVQGLYLAGHAQHPGGGVTMGGRATAQIIFADLGIDFDDVVSK